MTDKTAIILRIILVMMGLVAGFVCGRVLTPPRAVAQVNRVTSTETPAVTVDPGPAATLDERMAALPRTQKAGMDALLAAIVSEWKASRDLPGYDWKAMTRLRQLFSRWVELSPQVAVKAAASVPVPRLHSYATQAVLAEWALTDDYSALQAAMVSPSQESGNAGALAAVRQSAGADATGVFRDIKRLNQRVPALNREAGAMWLAKAPEVALEQLSERQEMASGATTGGALALWIMRDPLKALTWVRQLPARERSLPLLRWFREPTDGEKFALGEALAATFGDLGSGVKWMTAHSDTSGRSIAACLLSGQALAAAVDQAWLAETGGGIAGVTARPETWLVRSGQQALLMEAARLWALDEPGPALAWLAAMPPEREAVASGEAVATQWLLTAPSAASAALLAGDLVNPVNLAAALVVVERSTLQAPDKVLEMLPRLKLDDAGVRAFRTSAMSTLAATDRKAARGYIQKLPAGQEKDALIITLVNADIEADEAHSAASRLLESLEYAASISATQQRVDALKALLARMQQLNIATDSLLKKTPLSASDRAALTNP